MSELEILGLVLPVVAPVFVGWLIVQARVMKAADAKALSCAFLYIFLPALLVEHLARQKVATLFDLRFIAATAGLMAAIYVVLLIVHKFLLHRALDCSAVAAFAGSKFNAVVVGLPLLLIPLGRQAVVPVIVNLVLSYFTIFPVTLVLLDIAKAEQNGQASKISVTIARALRHTARDPLIVATVAGLVLSALEIELPWWIRQILSTLGAAAVPVPLVAVGMTICIATLRENAREILWMSAVRVLAAPLIAIEIARLFHLSPVFAIALVISFSLPTAKIVFAVAEEHDVYIEPVAGIVTVTTLAMIVVYPIFIWLCEQLWPGVITIHL